ncbi:MAG: restriction endonuclease [Acidobacteria bacterium]|nr:restriction endonuclease [Acidobacteriota bacterium]
MADSQRLPRLPSVETVAQRLRLVFPEGLPQRQYLIRDLAARTVFAMLYIGAVEGSPRRAAPKHVYRMSDDQARLSQDGERVKYGFEVMKPGYRSLGRPWYADTTREPIRDETLRSGLLAVDAAVDSPELASTSSKPRYALRRNFARLFDPSLDGASLARAIQTWQRRHLNPAALTRVLLLRERLSGAGQAVTVTFPNGEGRRLSSGQSSIIAKAVIEVFAREFLENPAVVWLSESSRKVVQRDDEVARRVGLSIDVARVLPDVVLVDLGPQRPRIVFVEVVETGGAMTDARVEELRRLIDSTRFRPKDIAFVTAYVDRSRAVFRATVATLAASSFAWFVSEPTFLLCHLATTSTTQRRRALFPR